VKQKERTKKNFEDKRKIV